MFSSQIYSIDDVIENRYRVEDIKRGAMGAVYLCHDLHKDQPVAIKTFHENRFKSQESRNRFLEEALMWIQMGKHSNVVQAFGLRLIHEKPYLMMERIMAEGRRGVTLKDLIYSEHTDAQFMMQIAINICDGMLHALSVFPDFVHSDLKPENVLIGLDDVPKITDFGLTSQWKQTGRDSSVDFRTWSPQNLAALMEGTPAFSSPEQCRLLPLDTRSDIYSFGCILYNMAARRNPFMKNEVYEYIEAHVNEEPMPPNQLNSEIPDQYNQFILKCMAKRPEQRFASFDEVRRELMAMYEIFYAVAPVSNARSQDLTFDEHIERAWSFALVGRFDDAERGFRQAGAIDPARRDINIQWGRYCFARKKYSQAVQYLESAVKEIPDNAEVYEILGQVYHAQQRLEQSQYCYRAAIRLAPHRLQVYDQLARIYRETGQRPEVESLYEQGALACGYPPSFVNALSLLYREKGAAKKLNLFLRKALSHNPSNLSMQMSLARSCLEMGNRREAISMIQTLAKSKPDTYHAWAGLAELYMELNDYKKASDACKMALTLEEGDGEFYRNYSLICHSLREYEEAWSHAMRAEECGEDVDELKTKIQAKRLGGRAW